MPEYREGYVNERIQCQHYNPLIGEGHRHTTVQTSCIIIARIFKSFQHNSPYIRSGRFLIRWKGKILSLHVIERASLCNGTRTGKSLKSSIISLMNSFARIREKITCERSRHNCVIPKISFNFLFFCGKSGKI